MDKWNNRQCPILHLAWFTEPLPDNNNGWSGIHIWQHWSRSICMMEYQWAGNRVRESGVSDWSSCTEMEQQPENRTTSRASRNSIWAQLKIFGPPPPKKSGGTPKKIMPGGTTTAHLQTIYRWTAHWLHPCKHEMSDKSGTHARTQPVTMSNSSSGTVRRTFARQWQFFNFALEFCQHT